MLPGEYMSPFQFAVLNPTNLILSCLAPVLRLITESPKLVELSNTSKCSF